jgi:hypothetical protein
LCQKFGELEYVWELKKTKISIWIRAARIFFYTHIFEILVGCASKARYAKQFFFRKFRLQHWYHQHRLYGRGSPKEPELPQIHNKRATSTTCKLSKLQRLMGNFLTSRAVVERESLTSKRPYSCERPIISLPTAHRI